MARKPYTLGVFSHPREKKIGEHRSLKKFLTAVGVVITSIALVFSGTTSATAKKVPTAKANAGAVSAATLDDKTA